MAFLHQIQYLNIHSRTIPASGYIALSLEDTRNNPVQRQSLCSFIPDASDSKRSSLLNCWTGHLAEAGIEDAGAAAKELYAACAALHERRLAFFRAANSNKLSLKQSELCYLAAQYGKTFEELYNFISRHASDGLVLQWDNAEDVIALDIDTLIQQVANCSGLLEEKLQTFLMS